MLGQQPFGSGSLKIAPDLKYRQIVRSRDFSHYFKYAMIIRPVRKIVHHDDRTIRAVQRCLYHAGNAKASVN
jgi:predicted class III extradiol MEMO1 family dioxygenase